MAGEGDAPARHFADQKLLRLAEPAVKLYLEWTVPRVYGGPSHEPGGKNQDALEKAVELYRVDAISQQQQRNSDQSREKTKWF